MINPHSDPREPNSRFAIPVPLRRLAMTGSLTLSVGMCGSAFGATMDAGSFQALGDLPGGGFFSGAYDVSANGGAVVGVGASSSGPQAFRWTSATGMTPLGSEVGSIANAISADQSTIVGSTLGPNAFRWTAAQGMNPLGDLPGGETRSVANATALNGTAVVGSSGSGSGEEAFLWTAGVQSEDPLMMGLGDLSGGAFFSEANGISADGSIIVGESISASGREAFYWTESNGMQGLGDLSGGQFGSLAKNISANGQVIVGSGNSADGEEAVRWTLGQDPVSLGELPGGDYFSTATDVSEDGSVIIGQSKTDAGFEAFVWDQANGMRSLQDVLINEFGLLALTNWQLTEANGISADGMTIVGTGINPNGATEAFLVTIPEPSTFGLMLLICLGGYRRR